MARKNPTFKCEICGKSFDSTKVESVTKYIQKSRNEAPITLYYCPSCAEGKEEPQDKKAHYPSAKAINKECKKLNAIIEKICRDKENYIPLIRHQLKLLKEDSGWSYEDMADTIQYVMNWDNPPSISPEKGIRWLIERYYDDAMKHKAVVQRNDKNAKAIHEFLANEQEVESVSIDSGVFEERRKESINRLKETLYGPDLDFASVIQEEEDE